jgi:hypothetical protein
MADYNKLTKEELSDLKLKLKELEILFKENVNEFNLFKEAPMTYLRSKNIKALKHIRNFGDNQLLSRLHMNLRAITSRMDFFNLCSWCKITVLLTIYSILGVARFTVYMIRGVLEEIIEGIEGILNLSNTIVESLRNLLTSLNEKLSPYFWAKFTCKHIGYCPAQD